MSAYEYVNKIWKANPPGPEQLLLDEMFENGSISAFATDEYVRKSSDMFKEFTPKVFAAHFRKTKARLGEFVTNTRGIPGGVIPPPAAKNENAGSGFRSIAELGPNVTLPPTKRSISIKPEVVVDILNTPYTTWMYTDNDLKNDYVCVAINIFTGSKSMTFDITEDGLKVIAKFSWPSVMHNPAQMFHQSIKDKVLSMQHPMIHAMTSSMLDYGITENSNPEGQWVIPLPCKVRREVTSYSMTKISFETTMIMFLKFTAYQNDIIIEQANRTMTF